MCVSLLRPRRGLVTGNAANPVVVYPRVDYPLCWCCVAGSLGAMSANGGSYTPGKDALRFVSVARLVNRQTSVSRIPSLLYSQFPALPFRLFKLDGRE
jgi:hypothetical protein